MIANRLLTPSKSNKKKKTHAQTLSPWRESGSREAVIGDIARIGDGAQRMLQRARRGAEHGVLAVGFCHGGLFQRHQLKQAGPYSVG